MKRFAVGGLPWLLAAPLITALGACAATVEEIEPGASPPRDSDEAGLWMVMEKTERQLLTSGRLADDQGLQSYVQEVACKVSPEYCADVRVYVVEHAGFNASMAPNGFMTIWTGALLRCANEAQLAAVLGHEMAHYQRRHSLELWRSLKNTTNFLTVLSFGTAMAGYGAAGDLAALMAFGGLMSFSRDNEREADEIGFELMTAANYDPEQASRIWEGLIAEKEAADEDEPFVFFATHPPSRERFRNLRDMAAEAGPGPRSDLGRERYLAATLSHRGAWLEAELNRHRFERLQVVLERLLEQGGRLAELYYYQGELHRRRGGENDAKQALAAYRKALSHDDPPAETYRAVGLLQWGRDEHDAARSAFQSYLEAAPQASDRALIESYIEELRVKG